MNFHDFLTGHGLLPRDIVPGRWMRCPTLSHPRRRNGSFKLALDGLVGWAQDFTFHAVPEFWRAGDAVSDPQAVKKAILERHKEERAAAVKALRRAREYWDGCTPLRNSHPYLQGKKLSMHGCANLRVDKEGWLVVPVMIERNLISLQRISPDGLKRFWSDATVKSGAYTLVPHKAAVTALCEGLATGLAVYQSVPDCRVIVCFDCHNMVTVAQRVRLQGLVLVAADNDHATEGRTGKNPGIIYGQEAAALICCGVAWPTDIQGSDWADLLLERGEAGPAQVKVNVMRGARFLAPRGDCNSRQTKTHSPR